MNHSVSTIIMANDPFKPLALAGAKSNSEDIKRLMDVHGRLLVHAHNQPAGKPLVAVVNLFTLGWLNGVRGKMVVKSFLEDQKEFAATELLMQANGSFIEAFRSLMKEQKLLLLPVSLSQFPLTAYTIKEAAKEDLQRTAVLWKELFGSAPISIWLPRGAFTAGLDALLLQEGCKCVFLPAGALPDRDHASFKGVSPHGLPVVTYNEPDGEINNRIIASTASFSELIFSLFSQKDGEAALDSAILRSRTVIQFPFCYENVDDRPLATPEELQRCETVFELKNEWTEKCVQSISEASSILDVEWAYCVYASFHQFDEELAGAADSLRYLLDGARKDFPDLDYAHQRLRLHYGIQLFSAGEVHPVERMDGAVLLITWEYPPNIIGGMARHVHGLAEALSSSGRDVIVLTASHHGSPAFETAGNVHIYRTGPLHHGEQDFLKQTSDLNLCLYQKGTELIDKHGIKLIHTHDWLTGDAAALLAKQHQLPLISTIHATEHGRNNGLHNELQHAIALKEKALIAASDTLIVCSQPMKEELRVYYEAGKKDIFVIPNGVEFEEVSSPFTRFSHFQPFVFSIGRMVFEKGFQTFFDLHLKSLKKENIQFIIAGKGPLLETWREEVNRRGLQDRLHFVGYVSDEERRALLQTCEAAVFPSLYEPFGIVALEAMAFQKPVIAAATGGLKSFVLHKQTGLLFEAGNAEDLSEKIEFVLDEPEYAGELGRNGYEMARELYSWTHISAQTEKVYDQTVFIKKMEGVRT
ncbi:glycosyltransferase [Domibacillus enclensis]|uniref:Glycosyltransferase involved in cell wall bisynthesis n=1 Tax=Domibacillus enclensis TaxID=1017273 RepID=A0A1N6PL53_9BACI|nr:glycosyltransferase [Domibacillus enclensis]OXS80405.1 hypothetical protein B1B05_02695 [Domibacillus enclensis]SIQ05036.1 Glycosyltransferase involved in cell wall bisynthesis [Domibacillus enclensis]